MVDLERSQQQSYPFEVVHHILPNNDVEEKHHVVENVSPQLLGQ